MIQKFADWLIYGVIGLDAASRLGESLNFFVYDTIKIVILLFFISILMGIINSYFPIEKLRRYLTTHKMYGFQYLIASCFGAITPFCSCSSIPLFIGFVKGGIPLGVTLAFLITSPLVNEVAVAMFLGAFGLKVTLVYLVSGITLGVIGGVILGRFNLERYLSPWILQLQKQQMELEEDPDYEKMSFFQKFPGIVRNSLGIVKGVIIYVLIGIGIGAAVHGYVPEGFFTEFMQKAGVFGVPASVLIAIPMYSNAAGIVPIVEVFVAKGIPLGTAISFMMAVVGLSLPEATMLKKVMTWKLIGIFFGSIALMIILLGWLFNIVL